MAHMTAVSRPLESEHDMDIFETSRKMDQRILSRPPKPEVIMTSMPDLDYNDAEIPPLETIYVKQFSPIRLIEYTMTVAKVSEVDAFRIVWHLFELFGEKTDTENVDDLVEQAKEDGMTALELIAMASHALC